ncbi:MAG: hypothetical protein ACF8PN_02900 [Phycisphaerales bacterium]
MGIDGRAHWNRDRLEAGESSGPADRPAEPAHPMLLDGCVTGGDPDLMARCMIEELLLVGLSPDEVGHMSHDENYQALYGLRHSLGERLDGIIDSAARRIGMHHHRMTEHHGDVRGVDLTIGESR